MSTSNNLFIEFFLDESKKFTLEEIQHVLTEMKALALQKAAESQKNKNVKAIEEDDEDCIAEPFIHNGVELYRTKDNRVYTEKYKWVGMWNPKTETINTSIPEPEYVD